MFEICEENHNKKENEPERNLNKEVCPYSKWGCSCRVGG